MPSLKAFLIPAESCIFKWSGERNKNRSTRLRFIIAIDLARLLFFDVQKKQQQSFQIMDAHHVELN
jgi:hypothetical protein